MVRLRIRYEKRGAIRFTSHRDLMRIFRRCFAVGEIPVRFSQGFNPHPRFSFGPSLRTGWESLDEYMDVLLEAPLGDAVTRCNRFLPEGLRVLAAASVEPSVPKLSADIEAVWYRVVIDEVLREDLDAAPADGPDGPAWEPGLARGLEGWFHRRFNVAETAGEGSPSAAPVIREIVVREGRREDAVPGCPAPALSIDYMSTMQGGRNVTPEELLTPVLGDPGRFPTPIRVTRTALYVRRRGRYLSPMSRAVLETYV